MTLGAQEVADRVRAEAGKPQADIWWGGTSQQFDQGVTAGLLGPFEQNVVALVPEKYRGKDNLWLAEQRLAEVIAYNNTMLTPESAPLDWDDLVKDEYKNKILIRDVAASGTMRSIFGAMILKTARSRTLLPVMPGLRSLMPTPRTTPPIRVTFTCVSSGRRLL